MQYSSLRINKRKQVTGSVTHYERATGGAYDILVSGIALHCTLSSVRPAEAEVGRKLVHVHDRL